MTDFNKMLNQKIGALREDKRKEQADNEETARRWTAFCAVEWKKLAGLMAFVSAQGGSVSDAFTMASGYKANNYYGNQRCAQQQARFNIPWKRTFFGKYLNYREVLVTYSLDDGTTVYRGEATEQELKFGAFKEWNYERNIISHLNEVPTSVRCTSIEEVTQFVVDHIADVRLKHGRG